MSNKGLIKSIIRIPGLKRFVFGSCFSKGDYMPEDAPTFRVRVFGEKSFEVGRDKLLSFSPGRKKLLKPSLTALKARMQIPYVESSNRTQNHPSGIHPEG